MAFIVEKQQERDFYGGIYNERRMEELELEKMLRSAADTEFKHSDEIKDGTNNLDGFDKMAHDKNVKQLFGQYVDNYVNFIVPPRILKPVGRPATVEADSFASGFAVPDGVYEESYSCCPPPVLMIIISLFEIGCFVADEVTQRGSTKYGNGGVAQLFIYNPFKRIECWRFLTYMFVHTGCGHLIVNLIIQIAIGIPLEMANRWWRVMALYLAGVIAGSLITSIVDPHTHLAGASGGVYAIITAHISTIIMNWRQMSFPLIRLAIFGSVITIDFGITIRNRYYHLEQNIAYAAHLGGALAGLLVGIWVLKNVEPTEKEKYLWWAAFVLYILLMGTAIMLNIFWTGHFFKTA